MNKVLCFSLVFLSCFLLACSSQDEIIEEEFVPEVEEEIVEELVEEETIEELKDNVVHIMQKPREGFENQFVAYLSPDELTINEGESVTIINKADKVQHLVLVYKVFQDGDKVHEPFEKNNFQVGENRTYTFEHQGEVLIDALWERELEGKIVIS